MSSVSDPVNGVWKAVSLVVVTILIAGAPGMIYALRTWSIATRVDLVQQRQDDVRDRLSRLEEKYANLSVEHEAQLQEIHRLQVALEEALASKP